MDQYIVCRVGTQYFTVPILSTNRIIPLDNITDVPDTIDYIIGIIESEEKVLPIIDLSKRFYDRPLKDLETAKVLSVNWQEKEIGLAVDEVVAIEKYDESQIDDDLNKVTTIAHDHKTSPLKSFIRTEKRIILELDIDNLFEMTDVQEIQALFDIKRLDELDDVKVSEGQSKTAEIEKN